MNRIVRHVLICVSSLLAGFGVLGLSPGFNTLSNISIALAWVSFFLLAIALAIGPINVLVKKANPVSSYVRRDISIWSGVLAVAHVLVGFNIHLEGNYLLYFLYPEDQYEWMPIRYGRFGIANHLGLIATFIVIYLLYLSRNTKLREMGANRWKSRQRLTYPYAIFILLHTVIYQFIEQRHHLYIGLSVFIGVAIVCLQISGRRKSVSDN